MTTRRANGAGDIPAEITERLRVAGVDVTGAVALVDAALAEDLADGPDVTSLATVDERAEARAVVVARVDGVVAGLDVAALAVHRASTHPVRIDALASDGERVTAGSRLMVVQGRARDLLLAERTALNLLCHLSGVATLTRRWVDAVAGSGTAIRDTRKTMPMLRSLEKYAVRCGGGVNHRSSLADAALVKDNHVLAAGGVVEAFRRVRAAYPDLPVEVEVDSVADALAVTDAGARQVLLDNFSTDQLREAVAAVGGRARLEASGGLRLERAAELAATGVDYLAVGALTHSAPALDIGLDFDVSRG